MCVGVRLCVCSCTFCICPSVPSPEDQMTQLGVYLTRCKGSALTGPVGGHVPAWQSSRLRLLSAAPPLLHSPLFLYLLPLSLSFYNVFTTLPSGLAWRGRANKCHTHGEMLSYTRLIQLVCFALHTDIYFTEVNFPTLLFYHSLKFPHPYEEIT